MSSVFSNDPLKETLSEIGLFLGFIIIVIVGFVWWSKRNDNKGKDRKKSEKGEKGEKGGKGGKGGKGLWWAFALLVFLAACVFVQVYMRNIRAVTDMDVQNQYSGMYDYRNKKWTSGWYTGLFYVTYIVTIPFSIFFRGPIITP